MSLGENNPKKHLSFSIDDILNKKPSRKQLPKFEWPPSSSAFQSVSFKDKASEAFSSVPVTPVTPVTPDSTTSPPHLHWTKLPTFYFKKAGSPTDSSPLVSPTSPQSLFFAESPLTSPSSIHLPRMYTFLPTESTARFDIRLGQSQPLCKLVTPSSLLNHERGLNIWSQVIHRSHSKRKGGQIRFTTNQTGELEKTFRVHKYLSPSERRKIAHALTLSERQVKTWFQNRRAKWRRLKQDLNNPSSSCLTSDANMSIIIDD